MTAGGRRRRRGRSRSAVTVASRGFNTNSNVFKVSSAAGAAAAAGRFRELFQWRAASAAVCSLSRPLFLIADNLDLH